MTEIFCVGSVCLDDLEKHAQVYPKNGKRYVSVVFSSNKEEFYGKTHKLILSKNKEDRGSKSPDVVFGNFKEYTRNKNSNTDSQQSKEGDGNDMPVNF